MISNEEIEDIMNLVKSLEDSGLLVKGATQIVEKRQKNKRNDSLEIFLDTLDANLLGNILQVKGNVRARYGDKGKEVKRGDGIVSTGYVSKMGFHVVSSFD